jgi:DeoR/GlpR family transcriptional regulator of sugar metabolism
VTVEWTVDAGAADKALLHAFGKVALRRRRILRLVAQACAQGAAPTDQDLARALSVTERTIIADIAALQAEGHILPTRRRRGIVK